MVQKFTFIFSILLISLSASGQNNYIESDSTLYSGIKTIDQGARQNALSCIWKKGENQTVEFTPYQIKSYSTGGKEYKAQDVTINNIDTRLFLEVLSSGNLTLYFVNKEGSHYFVEKDSILIEIPKRDVTSKKRYKEILQSLTNDCTYSTDYIKHTWYNRFYLKRFTKRYNACEEIFRPIRYGVIGGWEMTNNHMLKDSWSVSAIPTANNLTFGVFADIPLLQSNISFHPEILYSKQAYRTSENILDKECIANIESFDVPMLLRYTWWKDKWCPYINMGMVWHHYSRKQNSILKEYITDNVIDIRQTEPALSPLKYSITAGCGAWYKLTKRNSIFAEVRVTNNKDKFVCNVFTGINF